jgi:hypothetical protein
MGMRTEYDRAANAIYIWLSDKPYAYGEDLDLERRIDYADDATAIGVELTCVDEGVDLTDLPNAHEIADALKNYGIRVYA